MQNDYEKAKHEGDHAYRRAILSGRYPYLPALNSMVQVIDKYPVRDLGIKEIPMYMIAGTKTVGRQNSFAGQNASAFVLHKTARSRSNSLGRAFCCRLVSNERITARFPVIPHFPACFPARQLFLSVPFLRLLSLLPSPSSLLPSPSFWQPEFRCFQGR